MTSHPNRSQRKDAPGRNPTAREIKSRRLAAVLSQPAAAQLTHVSLRSWEEWESGRVRMHPNHWRCFILDTAPLVADRDNRIGAAVEYLSRDP